MQVAWTLVINKSDLLLHLLTLILGSIYPIQKYIYITGAQFAAPTFSRGSICHRIGEGPNLPKTGLEDPRLQWNSSISILA